MFVELGEYYNILISFLNFRFLNIKFKEILKRALKELDDFEQKNVILSSEKDILVENIVEKISQKKFIPLRERITISKSSFRKLVPFCNDEDKIVFFTKSFLREKNEITLSKQFFYESRKKEKQFVFEVLKKLRYCFEKDVILFYCMKLYYLKSAKIYDYFKNWKLFIEQFSTAINVLDGHSPLYDFFTKFCTKNPVNIYSTASYLLIEYPYLIHWSFYAKNLPKRMFSHFIINHYQLLLKLFENYSELLSFCKDTFKFNS